MTDEEGGLVQRMANLVGWIPRARTMGATMTPAQIETLATQVGRRMLAAGVTMDLAPVLDVDGGVGRTTGTPDGTRSFSANVAVVARDGLRLRGGLERAGADRVVKHFPGLGGVSQNTDVGPATTIAWGRLEKTGLVPFVDAINWGVGAVMVANASIPGLTAQPAGLSPVVETSLLRGRLRFRGLIVTDSLTAVAIAATGLTLPQAAVADSAPGPTCFSTRCPAGASTRRPMGSCTASSKPSPVASYRNRSSSRPSVTCSPRRRSASARRPERDAGRKPACGDTSATRGAPLSRGGTRDNRDRPRGFDPDVAVCSVGD